MFEVTIRYKEGKEFKTVTGLNIPCDGPFHPFWVIDIGDGEHFCISRSAVVTIECTVPETFIIPIEQILAGAEMSAMQFDQQIKQMREQPESGGSFG